MCHSRVMKLFFLLMSIVGGGLLSAKWAPMNEAGLMSSATDIVVADYVSLEDEKGVQEATFKVVECWKGKAGGLIKLRGTSHDICAPVVNFTGWKEGRYLLLLQKSGEIYRPFQGRFSVVPIQDGALSWFTEGEASFERGSVALEKVKARVTEVVAAERAEFKKGVMKAEGELEKGEIRYEILGQPGAIDQKLKVLAKEKLGVELVFLGCIAPLNQDFHRGHQDTVKAFLFKKHGHDPVTTLEASLK